MRFSRSDLVRSYYELISDKKMVETLLENVDPNVLWPNEAMEKIMNDSGTTPEDILANMQFPRSGPYSLDEFISDKKMLNILLKNADPKLLIYSEVKQKIRDDISIAYEDIVANIPFHRNESLSSDNKFISDKEIKETLLENVDPNKLIISEVIPKRDVLFINKASLNLFSNRIYLKHEKNDLNKGFLYMVEKNLEFSRDLKKPLLIPMKKNHYFKLEILPFLFDKDDMYLKCYFTNDQKIFSMYSTKINNLFVNFYSISEPIEESEEDCQRFRAENNLDEIEKQYRINSEQSVSLNDYFE
jgi:hypothetical protein